MRDFSDTFKKDKSRPLLDTKNRQFTLGIPPKRKTREAREIRRSKVWDMFLDGMDIADIASRMGIHYSTVHNDIKRSKDIVYPLLVQDAKDHVSQYISEQRRIMSKAFSRIERLQEIEDLWVNETFNQEKELEDDWWEEDPVSSGVTKKKRKQQTIPISLKQEGMAPLLEVAAKASTRIAEVKGIKSSGVNVNITIDMMSDEALLAELARANIDPKLLGIGDEELIEGHVMEIAEYSAIDGEIIDET